MDLGYKVIVKRYFCLWQMMTMISWLTITWKIERRHLQSDTIASNKMLKKKVQLYHLFFAKYIDIWCYLYWGLFPIFLSHMSWIGLRLEIIAVDRSTPTKIQTSSCNIMNHVISLSPTLDVLATGVVLWWIFPWLSWIQWLRYSFGLVVMGTG